MTRLAIIKTTKYGKTYEKKVAYIYGVKSNCERYARPFMIEARNESTQEEVLARMQSQNPQSKYELAGIEVYDPSIKVMH